MQPVGSLLNKKNIISGVLVLFILISIPVGVFLVQRQQELRSRASGVVKEDTTGVISFSGDGVSCDTNGGNCTTTGKDIQIDFNSPLGPGVGATGTQSTPIPTPTGLGLTATPTPSVVPTRIPTPTPTP